MPVLQDVIYCSVHKQQNIKLCFDLPENSVFIQQTSDSSSYLIIFSLILTPHISGYPITQAANGVEKEKITLLQRHGLIYPQDLVHSGLDQCHALQSLPCALTDPRTSSAGSFCSWLPAPAMCLMILGTIISIPKSVERDVKQEIMATLHSFQSELFPGLLQSRSQNGVIYRGHNFARKIFFLEFC